MTIRFGPPKLPESMRYGQDEFDPNDLYDGYIRINKSFDILSKILQDIQQNLSKFKDADGEIKSTPTAPGTGSGGSGAGTAPIWEEFSTSNRIKPRDTGRDLNIPNLTASRVVVTDSDKDLASSTMAALVSGTTNQVTVTDDGDGTITLSTPQNIHTGATPTFAGLTLTGAFSGTSATLSGLTESRLVSTNASKGLQSNASLTNRGMVYATGSGSLASTGAPTNGQLLIGRTGTTPALGAITGTSNRVTVTLGSGTINITTPQDIHTGASPTFAGLTLSGLTSGRMALVGSGGSIVDDSAFAYSTSGGDAITITNDAAANFARMRVINDIADDANLFVWGSTSATSNFLGQTRARSIELNANGNKLLIGTTNNVPIYLGTFGTLAVEIDTSQRTKFSADIRFDADNRGAVFGAAQDARIDWNGSDFEISRRTVIDTEAQVYGDGIRALFSAIDTVQIARLEGGSSTYIEVDDSTATGVITLDSDEVRIDLGGASDRVIIDSTGLEVTGKGDFTGALSGTTGTFSGAISATSGTFSLNIAMNGDRQLQFNTSGGLDRVAWFYLDSANSLYLRDTGAGVNRVTFNRTTGDFTTTGAISGTTGTFSGLTSGRIPLISTSGLLIDDSGITWQSGGYIRANRLGIGKNAANIIDVTASSDAIQVIESTNAVSKSGYRATNSVGDDFDLWAYGPSASGTFLGQSLGDAAIIEADGFSRLLIGTSTSAPLVLGTNNTARLTIDSAGAATFSGAVNTATQTAAASGTITVNTNRLVLTSGTGPITLSAGNLTDGPLAVLNDTAGSITVNFTDIQGNADSRAVGSGECIQFEVYSSQFAKEF